jgi:hypothetical protein
MTILLGTQLTTFTLASAATSYYVSTTGSDSNAGTLDKPFATLMKAQSAAASGDTVYIRGGTYKNFTIADSDTTYNYVLEFTKSGITYRGYGSEVPIFDFSNIGTTKRVAAFYILASASNVDFRQLEVKGVKVGTQEQSEGFQVRGTNINLTQVNVHDTQGVGIYYTGHSTGTVYRCDSYNNIGITDASLGNSDGFGAHGDGVTFKECRSWSNGDDGYDCINSKGANTFDSCWAFNMKNGGDSNGFKVGGWGRNVITFTPPVHTVKNCISANNGAHGFYSNHQPGQAANWTYNTAYNNSKGNFDMLECATISNPTDISGTREVLHYNLAYKTNTLVDANLPSANNTNNSWNLTGVTMSDSDFQSLDITQLSKARGAGGALPSITFMKPTNTSKFKGLGHLY